MLYISVTLIVFIANSVPKHFCAQKVNTYFCRCVILAQALRHKCAMAHKMRQLINMNITKRLLFASRLVWIAAWYKMAKIL